jgi:hypothetical protein
MTTIYDQEILDGLKDKILANSSVSFKSIAQKRVVNKNDNEEITDKLKKTIAGFIENGRNFDLYHISSILASTGDNKNDDWFLPEEIWAARETPIYKQVNYGHNERDIIGVITGTTILGGDGSQILNESEISDLRDIVSHAVIWSYWEDDNLKDRFAQIIDDIENDRLFVSMESLFKNFDYMLIKDGQKSIIKRTKETSFLTKHLRIYGGSGNYNSSRIYRLLRSFTFSGKALVENPANARSIISDNLRPDAVDIECCDPEDSAIADINKNLKTVAETIMDPNEIAINALKAELAQSKAELENYKQAEAEKTSAEISELKATNESLQKQVAELTTLAQAAKDEAKKAECKFEKDSEDMKAECETKVAEANAKLQAVEAEKATAMRLSKLTSVKVESAKAEEILKTWASASDEQFDKVVELLKGSDVKPEKTKAEQAEFDLEAARATAEVINPNGDSEVQKTVAKEKTLAAKIAAQFNFAGKNKKGSK